MAEETVLEERWLSIVGTETSWELAPSPRGRRWGPAHTGMVSEALPAAISSSLEAGWAGERDPHGHHARTWPRPAAHREPACGAPHSVLGEQLWRSARSGLPRERLLLHFRGCPTQDLLLCSVRNSGTSGQPWPWPSLVPWPGGKQVTRAGSIPGSLPGF